MKQKRRAIEYDKVIEGYGAMSKPVTALPLHTPPTRVC